MDWRYYLIQYPEMRPAASETKGFYHWEDSPKNFMWFHLSKETRRSNSPYWNPFLWAGFVKAGFNDDNSNASVQWKDNRGYEENPILFSCGLALWMDEFSWRLGHGEKQKKLTSKLRSIVEKMHKQFPKRLDKDGRIHIPGIDSHQDIDYSEPEWEHHRKHDTVDRIRLILPIMCELAAIR